MGNINMDGLFKRVGFTVLWMKCFWYLTFLLYLSTTGLSVWGLVATPLKSLPLCEVFDGKVRTLTVWNAVTNIVALISALSFWHGTKGDPLSVTGSLCYLCNCLQMPVLFVMSQTLLFNSENQVCRKGAKAA